LGVTKSTTTRWVWDRGSDNELEICDLYGTKVVCDPFA